MKSLAALVVAPGLVLLAWGHHSPEEDAAKLTAEIEAKGATAKLLFERATKWRSIRKNDLALTDLQQALDLDQKFYLARREQAKLFLQNGDLKTALSSAEKALAIGGEALEKADAQMLLAEIHAASGAMKLAEADCAAAFAAMPEHKRVDWYLRRAQVQRTLGHLKQCTEGLREGYHKTFSIVLYSQWVDALLDTKQYAKALAESELQLPNLRFRSTWLLRRARALRGQEKAKEADADLREALAELNQRIVPGAPYPDFSLLAERAHVKFLLGDTKSAKVDYDEARQGGADQWMLWPLRGFVSR